MHIIHVKLPLRSVLLGKRLETISMALCLGRLLLNGYKQVLDSSGLGASGKTVQVFLVRRTGYRIQGGPIVGMVFFYGLTNELLIIYEIIKMQKDCKKYLKADPTKWLFEEDNASVRFFTLRDLAANAKNETEISLARDKIMERGIVPKILSKQGEDGRWLLEHTFNGRFQVDIEKKGKPSNGSCSKLSKCIMDSRVCASGSD